MRVVFPREPDAAVHLDVELRTQVGGGQGERGRHRRGVRELIAARRGSARGIPHRGGRQLGGHEHVGAVVLDRLEHGDRSTELLTLLGVLGRLFGALAGDARRFGRIDRAGVVDQQPGGRPG